MGTLPELTLNPLLDSERPKTIAEYEMLVPVVDAIGYVTVISHRIEPLDNFSHMKIGDFRGFGGNGFGLASYVTAIGMSLDAGRAFRTDPNGVSDYALAVWDKMGKMGVVSGLDQPRRKTGSYTQVDYRITPGTVQRAYADKRLAA